MYNVLTNDHVIKAILRYQIGNQKPQITAEQRIL